MQKSVKIGKSSIPYSNNHSLRKDSLCEFSDFGNISVEETGKNEGNFRTLFWFHLEGSDKAEDLKEVQSGLISNKIFKVRHKKWNNLWWDYTKSHCPKNQ